MKPETEKKLKKIKRISNILRTICKILSAIVICSFLVSLVAIIAGKGATLTLFDNSIPLQLAPLTVPARLLVVVMVALTMGVFFKILYHLHRLFGNYGRGDIFTIDSAGQIRQLGITALLSAGVNFLWGFTAIALMQADLPHEFQLHADGLFIGPVIIAISWFMEMAAEMREENELTV
jgi:Protein of unknown function (DUF2975)